MNLMVGNQTVDGIHWLLKDFPPMEINSYRQLFG